MQDQARSFMLPEWPGIVIFPDQADGTRFYAFPLQPRVARDESGEPLINLMVYGRKVDGRLSVSGGQFTITVDLELLPRERAGLESQLQANVVHPDWSQGEVTVKLLPDLSVSGTPSMMGANQCTLMASLSAAQAEQLQKAWSNGLRDASIRYQVTMRAATQTVFEESTQSFEARGRTTRSMDSQLNITRTKAGGLMMTLEGPVTLAADEIAGRVQTVGY